MKRSRIKPISKKRRAQQAKERLIKRELYDLCGGLCEWCKCNAVAEGHEIIFRSAGGDPTDEFNIIMFCRGCHQQAHGLRPIFSPIVKDVLLYFIREKRLKQGFKGG